MDARVKPSTVVSAQELVETTKQPQNQKHAKLQLFARGKPSTMVSARRACRDGQDPRLHRRLYMEGSLPTFTRKRFCGASRRALAPRRAPTPDHDASQASRSGARSPAICIFTKFSKKQLVLLRHENCEIFIKILNHHEN